MGKATLEVGKTCTLRSKGKENWILLTLGLDLISQKWLLMEL